MSHRNLRPCWLVPSSPRAPDIHSWRERKEQHCEQLSRGQGQTSPLPVGASCRGQRFAPAASVFLGQEPCGTKPQALEKRGTGLRSARLRGHMGLSSPVTDTDHRICLSISCYDPRLGQDSETKGLMVQLSFGAAGESFSSRVRCSRLRTQKSRLATEP